MVVELRMSPRRSVLRPALRLARVKGRGSSRSFAVRIEREADIPFVEHGLNRRGTEQRSLLVEHFDALRKRDATEIHQGGDKASRDLRRARTGHPDLVESQMNVVLPGHRLHEQSDLAVLVRNATVGERPTRELHWSATSVSTIGTRRFHRPSSIRGEASPIRVGR